MLRVALRVGETDVDPARIEEAEIVQTVEAESDTLSATLDARGAVIPPSGVRAEAWMDGAYMGGYVVGDLEWVTGEDGHTVRMIATGADLSASGLRTPATRARAGGLTLLALATQIAGDHGYEAVVHPDLAGVVLTHEDQIVESDLAYLVRVSDRYDADCRFSAGFILLLPRTSETTVKGLPLERTLSAFKRLRIRFSARWGWQAFIARYYDYDQGRPIVVRVGSTRGPAYEVAGVQASRDVALAAARRARTRLSERAWVLSGTTPGDPALIPHVNLTLPEAVVPEGAPLSWRLQEVVHRVNDSDGFQTEFRATVPSRPAARPAARPEAHESLALKSKVTFSEVVYTDPNLAYARLVEHPARQLAWDVENSEMLFRRRGLTRRYQ